LTRVRGDILAPEAKLESSGLLLLALLERRKGE
jgi:hypothetical protein